MADPTVPGAKRLFYQCERLDASDHLPTCVDTRVIVDDPEQANLVGSLCEDGKHRPVLDIDLPCSVVPSSTWGHFHLYIEHPMEQEAYLKLVDALAEAGLVQKFYAMAARVRGQTFVRPPWVKKPTKDADEQF